jgi:hypothetical protein
MTIQHLSQDELNQMAERVATPAQLEKLPQLAKMSWVIIKVDGNVGTDSVIIVSAQGVVAALMPNGTLERSALGRKTVKYTVPTTKTK